jgi:hypothetical protein
VLTRRGFALEWATLGWNVAWIAGTSIYAAVFLADERVLVSADTDFGGLISRSRATASRGCRGHRRRLDPDTPPPDACLIN